MAKKDMKDRDGRDESAKDVLTSTSGRPIAHNENIQSAGVRGPMMLQDTWYLEKMAHFDREVIPERRMHAKGSGAFGTFTTTHDITKWTKADLFSEIRKKTDVFMRFSTVAGERWAADAERDIRGFAMKFYTDEGNWDLVGNNTPVFFFRDPLLFPDLNHAVKRDPRTNMRSAQNNWDFWSMLPEALHQVTITMGDRGIPASYRMMNGYGSHTFSFINAKNERFWVKFHFKTQQGIENLTDEEAAQVVANDRESHQRDLFSYGDAQRYRLGVNHYQIPVNRSKVPTNHYHRDGAMRVDGNFGGSVHYNPNSYGMWRDQNKLAEPAFDGRGPVNHYDYREDDHNYYEQPGKLFNLMSADEKERLFMNTARNMGDSTELVKKRHIRHCYLADPAYGEGVAKALGIDIKSVDMNDTYGARA